MIIGKDNESNALGIAFTSSKFCASVLWFETTLLEAVINVVQNWNGG